MARSIRLALLAFVPFAALAAVFPLAAGGQAKITDGALLAVRSLPIEAFRAGSGRKNFGKLEFIGGLVMATENGELGAMSSIRFLPDGEHFISVMDTGYWAKGKIIRDEAGKLSGIGEFSIHEMIGPKGFAKDRKEFMDAEGLAIAADKAFVSFEQTSRIDAYPFPGYEISKPVASQKPLLTGKDSLKNNGGMEALILAPAASPIGSNLFYVSERSYNKNGDFIAAVQDGPKKGSFYVKRMAPFDITDGVLLDDQTFLLLERRFGLKDGIGTRIRRFKLADIQGKGETIEGETIFEADFTQQIDNMEGIDAIKGLDGQTHIVLISDDNHSLLERNLMLEFRLKP